MWNTGVPLAVWAADDPTGSGTGADQLVVIVGGIITAAIGGAVAIAVATINARANRTAPSTQPTSPPATADVIGMHEDIAVLRFRADDADERSEIVDRRLDQIERHLDMDNPRWRTPPTPPGR